jgi:hypothetical protein
MNKSYFLIILASIIFLFSCSRKTTSQLGYDYTELDQLDLQEVNFEYLNTKSKIRFKDAKTNLNANTNIRIKKDSMIWLSVSPALGIEAARCLITRDSIKIIDKINKEYIAEGFESLSERFNFNLSFDLIQSILIGNMPKGNSTNDKVLKKKDYFMIKQAEGELAIKNYISRKTMKLEKVEVSEPLGLNTLTLTYDNFQMLDNYAFAFNNAILFKHTNGEQVLETLLNIDHSKVEIADSDLSFPFNVPQKYARK